MVERLERAHSVAPLLLGCHVSVEAAKICRPLLLLGENALVVKKGGYTKVVLLKNAGVFITGLC